MAINGRKIVVIEKDDQGKPDLGKNLLAAAYGDDKVDLAVGPTASPVALAMLPVLPAVPPAVPVVLPSPATPVYFQPTTGPPRAFGSRAPPVQFSV
jgi:ABC-type branched-subunit amino acid transport system substrate-binding protein